VLDFLKEVIVMHVFCRSARSRLAPAVDSLVQDSSTWFEKLIDHSLFKGLFDEFAHQLKPSRNRIYTPLVTLWMFVIQCLDSDASCSAILALWISRCSQVKQHKNVSSRTGAYCRARMRLPGAWIESLTCTLGQKLEEISRPWLWKGFHVQIVDGTSFHIPDTSKNRDAYPSLRKNSPRQQHLPLMRAVGIFSLATGALLALRTGPVFGNRTGENSLFRRLIDSVEPSSLLLLDHYFSGYIDLVWMMRRQIHFVAREQNARIANQTIKRFGKGDRLILLKRSPAISKTISKGWHLALPEEVVVREIRMPIHIKGFRAKTLIIVTSLLNPRKYPPEEIAALYAERWNVELDFRIIKSILKMELLRCKTPAMLHKEVWAHLLGYNIVRLIMLDAACDQGCGIRELSFKQTLQLLDAFGPLIWIQKRTSKWKAHYMRLLRAIQIRVKNRPHRIEPRLVKYRRRKYQLLKIPRDQARFLFGKAGYSYTKHVQDLRTAFS
jgi:hypothetical protein